MAMTLVDYFKQAKSDESLGFIADLLRAWDPASIIKWKGVSGLKVSGSRWQTLPSTAFRKMNEGYTESSGTTEEFGETLVAVGGDVKIEKLFTKAKNVIEDPLTTQMQMKARALMFTIADAFINGNQGVNPDSFEGLKTRVSNMPSRQTIDLYAGGDGLPIIKDSTNEHLFLDALHQAIKYVDGANAFFCNETVYLGLGRLLRRLGLLEVSTDAYGKVWNTFNGVPFIDVGLKGDKSTEIITNTEDPGDGGNDCTSIYAVRMDTMDGLHGIALNGTSPEPYDPLNGGEMEGGPQFLRRIDWAVGLYNKSQYAIARVKGFRVAAA